MKWLVFSLLLLAPATAQDRFAPGNPWFQDFEATCRKDGQSPPIARECETGVLMGWQAVSGTSGGTCDFARFWEVADTKKSEIFNVLPWQTAVEEIFREPGVCDVGT